MNFCDVFCRLKINAWSYSYFRTEQVFYLLGKTFATVFTSDTDQNFIRSQFVGVNFNDVILYRRNIVQYVEQCGWIQSSPFVFNHLPFSSEDGTKANRISSAGTRFGMMVTNITCLEAEQRHTFYSKRRDRHFACFYLCDRTIVVIQKLYDDKFRLQMPAMEFATFGKRRLHFGGSIGGI